MLFPLPAKWRPAGRAYGGILIVFLLAQGGLAADSGAVTFPDHAHQPVPVLPECTCRYRGQNLSLGEHICLMSPNGPRLAECVREGNVTSWRQGNEGCTLSRLYDGSIGPRLRPIGSP
jgi:hypothetical protein